MRRKGKLWMILLAVALLVCIAAVTLAACDGLFGGKNNNKKPNDNTDPGGETNPSEHEHTFEEKWSYNDEYHWHAANCDHTTEKKDEAAHQLVWDITTPASCEDDGVQTGTCVCGYSETKTIDSLGHDFKTPWLYDDDVHWHKCSRCNKTDLHIEHTVTSWKEVKPATQLEEGRAEGKCTICGATLTKALEKIQPDDKELEALFEFKLYEATADAEAYYEITGYKGNLTDVVIPSKYKNIPVTSIGKGAFTLCFDLRTLTIGDSVQSIGEEAFRGCISLKTVIIGEGVTIIGKSAFAYCTGLTEITIPDSVTSIGDYVFEYCIGLRTVIIGEGVQSIGERAFEYCYKLVQLRNLSDVEVSSPAYIDGEVVTTSDAEFKNKLEKDEHGIWTYTVGETVYAFEYEGTDTNLDLSLDNKINAIYPYAFLGISGLFSITIPDEIILTSVTFPDSVKSIGEGAFAYCTGLTEITIPGSVPSIESATFFGCTGLKEIKIPDSVQSIGEDAFTYCTGLTDITIPDSVTSIGRSAFYGCTGLQTVTIGECVQSIGYEAFRKCTGLKEITISDSVTSIGEYAFDGCTGLQTVTIGDSVESIGYFAFYGCTGLQTVYYEGTSDQWDGISIHSYNDKLKSAKRYYFSEQPNYDGQHWHWNEQTHTPEVWAKEN